MSKFLDSHRLSLGTIRCVQEVLTHRSVSIAAEHLGISQPAVSQQIARFEKLSGISVASRNGNTLTVRSDAVASLIATIVEAENTLRGIARGEKRSKPRLGISDGLAAHYCRTPDGYLELGREFEIHIGHLAALAEMFTRGELDAAARPLFHYESAPDLVIDLPLVFVGCAPWSNASRGDEPIPVILETSQSPYTYYAKRLLDEAGIAHNIVARVDDYLVRSHFVAKGEVCTPIPQYLLRSLPCKAALVPSLPSTALFRFGLFHNREALSFKAASVLFDKLNAIVNREDDGRVDATALRAGKSLNLVA
ncbi:LysR family transcriptional regulator [Ensifer sp. SL37]|uniref:LysR family transcriptional regulator n=1 Tax=Ensifer sp. SL37 TaxID=2995137 RepID=UPI0022728B44|nr:LysR family transcriptional regulator [Ensifer sp. SL37]MCY1740814.1 LysR family transcriptional regulator [Ensifer sp. SL37]